MKKTKPLPEPLAFKAHGQELHPGYTIVDVAKRKIKVIAERRKSDSKVQFAVIPQNSTIDFKFTSALLGKMEANWHNKNPLLKIKGTYILDQGWVTNHMITSILVKDVDSFTPTPILKKNVFFEEISRGNAYHPGTPCRGEIPTPFLFCNTP